jgi:deoxyribose-phosphate aldolase
MTLDLASLTERTIAKTIDHSLLRPELDDAFVEDGCRLAAKYDVASVCVRPADVVRAAAILRTATTSRPSRSSRPSARSARARPSSTWSSRSAR